MGLRKSNFKKLLVVASFWGAFVASNAAMANGGFECVTSTVTFDSKPNDIGILSRGEKFLLLLGAKNIHPNMNAFVKNTHASITKSVVAAIAVPVVNSQPQDPVGQASVLMVADIGDQLA